MDADVKNAIVKDNDSHTYIQHPDSEKSGVFYFHTSIVVMIYRRNTRQMEKVVLLHCCRSCFFMIHNVYCDAVRNIYPDG